MPLCRRRGEPDMVTPASSDSSDKLRRRIASVAAKLLADGHDSQRARLRAARRVAGRWVDDDELPDHAEIRRQIDPAAGRFGDRFEAISQLVRLLETVRLDPAEHSEGDLLEHSLRVFAWLHERQPFDEELLTAALAHDVGRAIDRGDAVAAGLEALAGSITPRTAWLIEHLPEAHGHAAGTLGHRARRRLAAHADFECLLALAEADRKAAAAGASGLALEDAIDILRALEADEEEDDSCDTDESFRR